MPGPPGSSDYAAWRDRLAQANDPLFWPIAAIDALVSEGRGQFWCDGTAALVTMIEEYPGGARVLKAIAGAGDMTGLIDRIAPETERMGKQSGLSHLMVTGRGGWLRALKGWRHYQTVLLKDLA